MGEALPAVTTPSFSRTGRSFQPLLDQVDVRIVQHEVLQQVGIVRHAGEGQRGGLSGVLIPHRPHADVQGVYRALDAFQQQLTILVQHDFAPPAVKEGHADLFLQAGNTGAQIGLRDKERLRGFGHIAQFRHGHEITKL